MIFQGIGCAVLCCASVCDYKTKQIPRALLLVCAGVSACAALAALSGGGMTWMQFLYALMPGAVLLALSFLSRQNIGYGDGLLMLLAGPTFGAEKTAAGVLCAFFFSAVCSVILLILRRVKKKTRIPFVPFLTAGLGVMLFPLP